MSTKADVFESLLAGCLENLFSSARRLTLHREDAEDLLQQTLARAYQGFHNFRPGTNFRSWMFRSLFNTYRHNCRTAKRSPRVVSYDLDIRVSDEGEKRMSCHDLVLVDRHHPEQIVLDRLPQIELERALKDLPEDFRLVILLRDVEDLSYREIASLLDIPLGTVRSRINRARLRLRGALLTSGVDC